MLVSLLSWYEVLSCVNICMFYHEICWFEWILTHLLEVVCSVGTFAILIRNFVMHQEVYVLLWYLSIGEDMCLSAISCMPY